MKPQPIANRGVKVYPGGQLKGALDNFSTDEMISSFVKENNFSASQKLLIETVFAEANQNNFVAKVQFSK